MMIIKVQEAATRPAGPTRCDGSIGSVRYLGEVAELGHAEDILASRVHVDQVALLRALQGRLPSSHGEAGQAGGGTLRPL
jgi:hypothetical protein